MKATLEFLLPDDKHEFETACKAGAMAAALDEIRNKIREWVKYGERTAIPPYEIHDMFWGIVKEWGIEFE